MTIVATGLSNEVIGGKYLIKGGIRFRAKYSSPLAAIRCYDIDHAPGYSGGTGGTALAQLFTESMNPGPPTPGTIELARAVKSPDPQFPDPSSGKGRFPLLCFTPQWTMKQDGWYWIVFSDATASPATDYFSMDYLTGPPNQVADAAIYIYADGQWKSVPYLIPSPIVFHYANGLWQGLGWIGANAGGVAGALECGAAYGFPKESCV